MTAGNRVAEAEGRASLETPGAHASRESREPMEDEVRKSIVVVSAVTLLGLAALPLCFPGFGWAQDKAAAPSLYDRLGGLYPVSAVVDDFIDCVYVNATLNANPAIANARSALRKPGSRSTWRRRCARSPEGPASTWARG